MSESRGPALGRVVAIGRFPIKSMSGEDLDEVEVTPRGLLGDRAYALVDVETGKVASAKNPRRWPGMLELRARFVEPPADPSGMPAVRVALRSGREVATDEGDFEAALSEEVGRPVRLAREAFRGAGAEGYWPDHAWLPEGDRDATFAFEFPEGTFFDGASVHLVTTATLERLHTLAPGSRFDPRRFRPNFVIEAADGLSGGGFPEEAWIGRTVALGGAILHIDRPSPRCVMTTLKQRDLPADPDVLRTAVQRNAGNVGVYATVVRAGRVRLGDALG